MAISSAGIIIGFLLILLGVIVHYRWVKRLENWRTLTCLIISILLLIFLIGGGIFGLVMAQIGAFG